MRKIAFEITRSLAIVSAILVCVLHAAPANAANYHSWVAHNGTDANNCTINFACATFAKAVEQTLDGGEVGCLDSGNYGVFTVTVSMVIDCRGTVSTGFVNDSSVSCAAPTINVPVPFKVVTLRGLNLIGENIGCVTDGIVIQAAAAVYIEDCVIENFLGRGIVDQRTTGLTKLVIKNTIVRNSGSAGIVVAAAPKNSVVLENVQSVGNAFGIAVATGNNVVISRSVMSENSIAGIEADPGAQVYVENTKISHNAFDGVLAQGTVVLANSDITFNTSSISGATTSFGNNRLFGNGGGTAPTPAGGVSTDFGQQ